MDDSLGVTGHKWDIVPVMDRSDRKRMTRTSEDIAWLTDRAKKSIPGFPAQGVIIGKHILADQIRLVVLPDANDPSTLGPVLYRQELDGPLEPLGVTWAEFAPTADLLPKTDEPLPTFRYHLDPLATGSVRRSINACTLCRRIRGYEYRWAVASGTEPLSHVCPWCIADGSAATAGAVFAEAAPLRDQGVPEAIIEEVTLRTPGINDPVPGVQWQVCHDDACAFTGHLGFDDLWALPEPVKDRYGLTEDLIEIAGETKQHGDYDVFGFECRHCGETRLFLAFNV